jgi:phosphatidate phosphatase LPIN
MDIIVLRQPDGTLKSTPFHVRFGKLKILRAKNDRPVSILVNGEKNKNVSMKLGANGQAFFSHRVNEEGVASRYFPEEKAKEQKVGS